MAASKELKSSTFAWEGTDQRGRKTKGESQGTSAALIKAELRRQGITPSKISKKSAATANRKKKILTKDIAVFARQMATMMQAGVPLVQAFDIIGKGHDNPAMQILIMEIKADIEGGNSFSEALRKHPQYFDELFCNLTAAGEQAGVLDDLLDKIATYKEKTEAIKAKIKKALTYPTAIIIIAFAVTAILLVFVVPQFEDLFSGFGADLPTFTRMVIDLSEFMQKWWLPMLAGVIGGGVAFSQAKKKSLKFRQNLDKLTLKLPVVGDIVTKASIARYARTLATTFAAGVPLVEALETVAGATGNWVFTHGVLKIREEVSTGQQLQQAMKGTQLFPNMVVQMVAIGEESGSLDTMLCKVADFYEEEVDNMVDNLSSLLEPIIMAVLGILVGGLVTAMYLPIFKMGQVV